MSVQHIVQEIDTLLTRPISTKHLARWQRKKMAATASTISQRKKKVLKTSATTNSRRRMAPASKKIFQHRHRPDKSPRNLRKTPNDRFIPNRDAMDNYGWTLHNFNNENLAPAEEEKDAFKSKLAQALFEADDLNNKILSFKQKPPKLCSEQQSLRVLYTQNKIRERRKRVQRHITTTPERILDAPELVDDFYLNLIHWSSQDILAVALGPSIYLWDACTGQIELMCEATDGSSISSVSWMDSGSHLSVGMSDGNIQLWDVQKKTKIRTMNGHLSRVGALSWNKHILSSGSRDSKIFHHDVRVADHHQWTSTGHTGEICGLVWSPDGTQLASGGNDNMCCIWNVNDPTPRYSFTESNAAVKALAWCPWENDVLATGGGTADRHIRFYNTFTGNLLNSIDTNSQVCSLVWGEHDREIVSSHGFSQNQLTVWNYPSMTKVTELTGHTSRVLCTALSPDKTTVCSAAADETLRFWKIWDLPSKKKKVRKNIRNSSVLAKSIR